MLSVGGKPTRLSSTNRWVAGPSDCIRWQHRLRDKIHRFSEHPFCGGILSDRNRPGGVTCRGAAHRRALRSSPCHAAKSRFAPSAEGHVFREHSVCGAPDGKGLRRSGFKTHRPGASFLTSTLTAIIGRQPRLASESTSASLGALHGALSPPRGERHGVILTAAERHVSPRIAAKRAGKSGEASVTITDGSGDPA